MARSLRLDLRDPRIPGGGRLSVSAGTRDAGTRDAYAASILALLERPEGAEVVRRLRLTRRQPGALTPAEVHRAVTSFDLAALFATPAEAEAPRVPPAMLGATVDRFLQRIRSDNAPSTARSYETVCRQMEDAFGVRRDSRGRVVEDVAVASVSREAGEDWLKQAKRSAGDAPWSAAKQAVAHAVATQVWALARAQEEDDAARLGAEWRPWRNFWAHDRHRPTVRPARRRRTRHGFLSREQAARLLWTNRGTPRAAWVAVGLYGGLRVAEAKHLRVGADVDLARLELHVQPRKGDHPWRPKSDHGVRRVPINRALARWIRMHIADGYAGRRYLFHPAGRDQPISEDTSQRWTREAFERAGIRYGGRTGDGLSYHSLRHTFASWLAMRGTNPKVIAELLGDTLKIVMDFYLHLFPSERREAVEKLRRGVR